REQGVVGARLLLGGVADSAVEAANEEHRRRDAAHGENRRVVAGSRRKLDDRQSALLELGSKRSPWLLGHRDGLQPERRLELEGRDETVESLAVRRAGVDREADLAGDHVAEAGLDLEPTDGCDG